MRDYKEYLIQINSTLKEALFRLNKLAPDSILFVIDENEKLKGSLTDGDVRRGLLKGQGLQDSIMNYVQSSPKRIYKSSYSLPDIITLREGNFNIIPVVDNENRVVHVINLRSKKSYLPLDALVMAGGRGSRLRPMTDDVPKPLLEVGEKPIIDHNIDRLRVFGVDDFHISVRYLGDQIEKHFENRELRDVKLSFIREKEALGTLGAASFIDEFQHEHVLVMNSDILTDLNYEDFFLDFLKKGADMSVATVPYKVDIPYAVMETVNNKVISFKEKPKYTYYSNGGIYILKRKLLEKVPYNTFYNTTDLMDLILNEGGNLISYPIRSYWLDIGKPEDFVKAQEDIKYLDI